MEFKIGDKVKIKKYLDCKMYTSLDGECQEEVIDDMLKYRGTTGVIINIDEFGGIELSSNGWRWIDVMLEELKECS